MTGNRNNRILLTGATGFVGQYILGELLRRGERVVALVRATQEQLGEDRINLLFDEHKWPREWKKRVEVIESDLSEASLNAMQKQRVASCDCVIHAAASLVFHENRDGEPWKTNLDGTKAIATIARQAGVRRFLYVSTAYVCGDADGLVFEAAAEKPTHRNAYEASKYVAETWIRNHSGLDWTIVRPGIVVGHSKTGHTPSYFGLYRCLKSIALLARKLPLQSDGSRHLPMRLAYSGKETSHLIPVDWVSNAIVSLCKHPEAIRTCFHITLKQPTTAGTILNAVSRFYRLTGIHFLNDDSVLEPRNAFERIYDRETKTIGPYFRNDPEFDRSHLERLLPELSEIEVDCALLMRLLSFAEANDWGGCRFQGGRAVVDVADFFERYFLHASANSKIARIPGLTTTVRFEIAGSTSGDWVCRLDNGDVIDVHPVGNSENEPDFCYRTDLKTFHDIIFCRVNTREAFFERRIHISGDIERALMLAILFEDLLAEFPYRPQTAMAAGKVESCA